jgi:purine-binding chemotaxis protein CheW
VDLAKIRKKAKKKEATVREASSKKTEEAGAGNMAVETEAVVAAPAGKKTTPVDKPPVQETPPETPPREIEIQTNVEAPPQVQNDIPQKDGEKKLEKLLVFKVGRNRYAIPIGDLSQIIDDRILTPLPHVPDFLKGIFSLRGHIVGVIDVSERLFLQPLPDSIQKKIIVLEKSGDLFGLRVENIEHVVEVDISTLEAPPDSFDLIEQEFVVGVFHYKKKTVAFLNLEQFLDFGVAGRI